MGVYPVDGWNGVEQREAGGATYVKETCKGAAATNNTPLTSTTGSKEPKEIVREKGSPCNALLHCCKMWLVQQPACAVWVSKVKKAANEQVLS